MHDHDHTLDTEKLEILLPHLLDHNREHVKDLEKWAGKAEDSGLEQIAPKLRKIVELYEEINTHFESAIEELRT